MNHLLVFDIDNTEADYSVVMEGISLLEAGKIGEFTFLKNTFLQDRFYRVSQESMTASPRYHECPMVVRNQKAIDETELPALEDIPLQYYDALYGDKVRSKSEIYTMLHNLCIKSNGSIRQVAVPNVILGQYETPGSVLIPHFATDIRECRVFYSIRVRVDRGKPYDLQYLALLLKCFPYLVKEKRITALLLDSERALSYYPFCDPRDRGAKERLNQSHQLFSQYLRLLAKDNTGAIYAPLYELSKAEKMPTEPIIAPIDYKNPAAGDAFFPLVEIGKAEYDMIFNMDRPVGKAAHLSAEIRKKNLCSGELTTLNRHALFQIGLERFYGAAGPDPRAALLPYIAETAWRQLRRNWTNETGGVDIESFRPVADAIISVFTAEKNNWLCFAIFAFLLRGEGDGVPTSADVQATYLLARELSSGLQQLIQNAVQHTESASCIFTFYLDREEQLLHLYVSDLNMRNTIVETFKQRLRSEITICRKYQDTILDEGHVAENFELMTQTAAYNQLIQEEGLALRHFFNVFAEYSTTQSIEEAKAKRAWSDFRKSDSTAHIGLLAFFQAIMRAQADLIVQSTCTYRASADGGNLFISMAKDRELDTTGLYTLDKTNQHVGMAQERAVPGTHYLIHVPIVNRRLASPVGSASLSDVGNFIEDYNTFAKYVDFMPCFLSEEVDTASLIEASHAYEVTQADEKFQLQLVWTEFWQRLLSDLGQAKTDTVFVWHIQGSIEHYLSVGDNAEVSLKGLFAALSAECTAKNPIYLAITNLPPAFFTCLKNVCISLSNRNFSPRVQLFFSDADCEHSVQLFGASLYEAVSNAVKLAIEHGSNLFGVSDMASARHIAGPNKPALSSECVQVMPFDAVIPVEPSAKETLFDRHIFRLAQQSLEGAGTSGYKLENTHVRLGNKVHIGSFYEMSFLFYRTTIANRTAFQILRNYSKELLSKFDRDALQLAPILFYSYASYSKAILTSIVEISRAYIVRLIQAIGSQMKPPLEQGEVNSLATLARAQIGFASYQHNLQSESTSDSVQLYFGIPKNYSGGELAETNSGRLKLYRDVAVVQIVPISSTLSTFDKMLAKLRESVSKESHGALRLSANYTTMWVFDNSNLKGRLAGNTLSPSDIEKAYWKSADIKERCILVTPRLSELTQCPKVNYSVQGGAHWENPLLCKQCFPDEDKLILEVPLVETDLTSTVPSMQIRKEQESGRAKESCENRCRMWEYIRANNQRMEWLSECVYYGHIRRGKNHHQYYINTQDYFYKDEVQQEIERWLKELPKPRTSSKAKLKIIFSPEHNTNVGFAQYVNAFYFGGSAEIISVNEDKIYRSNFVCEHEMLRSTIARAYLEGDIFEDNRPVEFYFVDDTINTGTTIHKANSLLHSLLPKDRTQSYPAFLFSKCFVLVDRMSDASKRAYVESGSLEDFHSFLHIDISNMRVHGDSCVGCKLQKNAKKLFKRSASRSAANYWANKYKRLLPIDYDDLDRMSELRHRPHAYARLVLSHVAQNYIFKDAITTREKGEYYDGILFLFSQIMDRRERPGTEGNGTGPFFYVQLVDYLYQTTLEQGYSEHEVSRLLAELLLKLLSRPFFSFDYSFRLQLQSFLLILSECYLFHCVEQPEEDQDRSWLSFIDHQKEIIPRDDPHKSFLLKNKRVERTVQVARSFLAVHEEDGTKIATFLKDVLFEALADIRSTYLLRRRVLSRVNRFVNKYLGVTECEQTDACPYLLDPFQCGYKRKDVCFWVTYLAHVQREVDCTNDEIKTIWLEYLILAGQELNYAEALAEGKNFSNTGQDKLGIQDLVSDTFSAAEEFFLATTGVEFDRLEKAATGTYTKVSAQPEKVGPDLGTEGNLLRDDTLEGNWRKWLGHKNYTTAKMKEWYRLLSSSPGSQETEKSYEVFLSSLRDFIADINEENIDADDLTVALLTMSTAEKKASIEKLQLVHSIFGKSAMANHDTRRARYIIKDRVVCAFNNDCGGEHTVGALVENGYHIVFPDSHSQEEYLRQQEEITFDDQHHVLGSHRKPYLVLLFDNPKPKEPLSFSDLDRKLIPLSYVFLYVSIHVPDEKKWGVLPRIVMRDILTYRNKIMRLLEKDFSGDLMETTAEALQERVILTHERSASHASTTDDAGILRVFGLIDISQMRKLYYPVSLKTPHRILDTPGYDREERDKLVFPGYPYSADLWLLLQSYVNGQIARLFSRHFNSNDTRLVKDEGIPALYLAPEDEQTSDIFKQRAEKFGDLKIAPESAPQDNRFALLSKAADIRCYVTPDSELAHRREYYYNAEYIRCILLDVVLTSMKYATVHDSLLPRVDSLMYEKECSPEDRHEVEQLLANFFKPEYTSAPPACHILMFRHGQFLIILNNVKPNAIHCDPVAINEEIFRRTHDVLDYGDGHMSLFTIRQFVRNLWAGDADIPDVSFRYITREELARVYGEEKPVQDNKTMIEKNDIWFETKLPIFEEVKPNET